MAGLVRYLVFMVLAVSAFTQENGAGQLTIVTKDVPAALLWAPYQPLNRNGFNLRAEGAIGAQHWRIVTGSLPGEMTLAESGTISGTPQETGEFEFTVQVSDESQSAKQKLKLRVPPPLLTDWDKIAHVNGQRIEGSVKVSNQTGRDIDLTFIVLAVDATGRATAIGYQHFPLKKDSHDFQLPFGENLAPGSYTVNIDVVGEEPVSNRIFRGRLVTQQTVLQGP